MNATEEFSVSVSNVLDDTYFALEKAHKQLVDLEHQACHNRRCLEVSEQTLRERSSTVEHLARKVESLAEDLANKKVTIATQGAVIRSQENRICELRLEIAKLSGSVG